MKRRIALKRLGLGLSAGLVLPELLSSCKKGDPGPELNYSGTIAVVGAGAAGLYAADILRSKGVKVILLEAGDEMGGRIKSLRNQTNIASSSIADFPVELGAEVVYGSNSIWGNIIRDLKVPYVDLLGSTDKYILDGQVKLASEWGSDPDYNAVKDFLTSLPNYTGTSSISDAATVSSRASALLNSQAGNFYGSQSANVGAQGVAEELKVVTHDTRWITAKANPLQDLLLSRFNLVTPKVQLNHAVQQITYDGTKVTIAGQDTSKGSAFSIEVDKVIVTVPLTVLKAGTIAFSPNLPSSMSSSLANLGMDPSIRVVLDFKKNFWGTGTGFIWGGTEGPQYFNTGTGRSQFENTLSITINGPKAVELSALGADMVNPILAELDALYNNQATLYIRRDLNTNQVLSTIMDWSKEAYILGAYSYPLPGSTINDRKSIGAPINNLYFAGEATDISGDAGTINGALASAERVVEEVVKSIIGA